MELLFNVTILFNHSHSTPAGKKDKKKEDKKKGGKKGKGKGKKDEKAPTVIPVRERKYENEWEKMKVV